ncbi:uncharacterized protein LOC123395845 isoform X2 [Hordeum vulgare subsp. vulgare]|uniref:uncharacterized protein LOC123395845 isoform X2 n=1 Tax=Hordeum vulgare subsp. vulgare TaxID=112509 RepID=UPI00162D3E30|nr:uncharacterized protein LOC123395845 isoform X2 [Hordeum vulgare subsp. vulgare]
MLMYVPCTNSSYTPKGMKSNKRSILYLQVMATYTIAQEKMCHFTRKSRDGNMECTFPAIKDPAQLVVSHAKSSKDVLKHPEEVEDRTGGGNKKLRLSLMLYVINKNLCFSSNFCQTMLMCGYALVGPFCCAPVL